MAPPDVAALPPDPLNLATHPADALFLVQKLTHVSLYNPPTVSRTKGGNPTQAEQLAARSAAPVQADPLTPQPGLSQNDLLFLLGTPTSTTEPKTYKNTQLGGPLSPQQLSTTKSAALRLLSSSLIFPEIRTLQNERYWAFTVASCDANSDVASRGEDGTKKIGRPDCEDAPSVGWFYDLYARGGSTDKTPAGPARVQALSPQLKTKLLSSILQRSAAAGNSFPALLQTMFDALFATTDIKLRMEGMRFAVWCLRVGKLKADGGWLEERIGAVLLGGFTKLVEEEPAENGEARTGSQMLREASARQALTGLAYEAVGLLSSRVPTLFSGTKLGQELLPKLFVRIEEPKTSPAERQSILDALSVVVQAYAGLDEAAKTELKPILFAGIRSDSHHARFAAAKFGARLYPFSDAEARVLCLLATMDSRMEIREEGTSALVFQSKMVLPNLSDVLAAYAKWTKTEHPVRGKTIGGVPIELHGAAVDWIRCLILRTATNGKTTIQFPSLDVGGEEALLDADTRNAVRIYLRDVLRGPDAQGMRDYLSMLTRPLLEKADDVLQGTCAGVLLEVVGMGGAEIREGVVAMAKGTGGAVDWLKPFLSSTKLPLRHGAAHLLGLIGSSLLEPSEVVSFLGSMVATLDAPKDDKTTSLEARHGAILAIGYLVSRLSYRDPGLFAEIIGKDLLGRCVSSIVKELESGVGAANTGTLLLVGGSALAVGELGRYVALPVKDVKDAADSGAMDLDSQPKADSEAPKNPRDPLVQQLSDIVKKAKDTKLQEQAIVILSHLCLGDAALCQTVLDLYFSLATLYSKQIETHFTVGEAIATVVGGWGSASVGQYLDLPDVSFPPPSLPTLGARDPAQLDKVLGKLDEMLSKGSTASRKAVCVWLLSLVKFCSGIEEFRKKLPQVYAAFRSLLTDRDEFTQEVASKGIGLVYELGDKETRSELVKTLMGNLIDTKKQLAGDRGTLTGDTQLFDQSLGSAPGESGGGISTYQSILSLAADMNQPDLVYKFMNLASHNAIWSSRRGASMGIASIMAAAEEELAGYLPTLAPKLYRFRFDPNPKVAEAMNNIWRALVKEPQKALDAHFDTIMKDLLAGMGDRLWRTREASCSAMADLLNGRSIELLQPYLDETWTMCFRCLDDIKESVRTAALSTCKTLTNVTVKHCDPTVSSPKEGQKIMDIVLPFMLQKGLSNLSKDVRMFSLQTILKLSKKGGVLLKPHVPDLVSTLLESLSDLEPQAFSYFTFHAEKQGITQEQLDSSRLNVAKGSPMMQTVESAVDQVDETNIGVLLPRLSQIARKGVGLPTKAGCARFIVTLVVRVPTLLGKQEADSLMRNVLAGMIGDRNVTLRKAYAVSIGYLGSVCSTAALAKLVDDLKKMYVGSDGSESTAVSDDPDAGLIPAFTLRELSRHGSDALKANCLDQVLPLAYYGMHDANKGIADAWKDVFEDNTAGASSALRMYLAECVTLLGWLVGGSASWTVKRQAGETVRDVAKALSGPSGTVLVPYMEKLVKVMLEAVAGRTWEGKEAVLEGLVGIVASGKDYFAGSEGQAKLDEIFKVLVREAKKNNKVYRKFAIEQWGNFLDAFPERDYYEKVHEVLIEATKPPEDSDSEDDGDVQMRDAKDGPTMRKESQVSLGIRMGSFKALVKAFPFVVGSPAASGAGGTNGAKGTAVSCASSAQATQEEFGKALAVLLAEGLNDTNVWTLRQAVLQSIEIFLPKLNLTDETGSKALDSVTATLLARQLLKTMSDWKYSSLREAALRSLRLLFERIKGSHALSEEWKLLVCGELEVLSSREGLASIKDREIELRREIEGAMVV